MAALALAVAATYANSLSIPFVLDDEATVVQNLRIRDLSRLDQVLVPAADSPIAGRPLASVTFALNYAAGRLDVRGYHAVNIALHLLCALMLLVIVRRTLGLPRLRASLGVDPTAAALAAALLWALHPLASEVVNYLSQRTESLMALCYLLMIYAAMRAAGSLAPRRWEAVAVVACAAGALAKESIVTAPLMVAAYDRVFLFDSWRASWAGRRRLYYGLAGSLGLAAIVIASGAREAVVGFSSGVSPWTYLLNQAEIIIHYLRLTIWPDALVVFYGWPRDVTFGDVAPSFTFIGALIVLTAVALWRWPALGFLGAWFFTTLAPASSIVPVATEVGAERRMYVPLMALAVLAAAGVSGALRRLDVRASWAPVAVVLPVVGALAVATVMRNREYASGVTLARTVVERRPTAVAHHYLAEQLLLAGNGGEALPHLRESVAGGNSRAAYVLGRLLFEQGKHEEAIPHLEAFVRTSELPYRLVPRWLEPPITEVVPARLVLGQAYAVKGDWGRVEEQGERILQLVPTHPGAHGLLGDVMFAREQWAQAADHYRRYLARQPADTGALINYGIARVAVGDLDDAVDAFGRATRIDPANARARQLLTLAEQDRARIRAAQPD